jgi:hypothetical protein
LSYSFYREQKPSKIGRQQFEKGNIVFDDCRGELQAKEAEMEGVIISAVANLHAWDGMGFIQGKREMI